MRHRLGLVLLLALATAAPAQATLPGGNGPLVVSVEHGCDFAVDLFTAPEQGGAAAPLTSACDQSTAKETRTYTLPAALPGGAAVLSVTNAVDSELAVVPLDGSAPTEIPLPGQTATEMALSPFPDGQSLAYADSEDELLEVFLDGREPRVIREAPDCTYCEYGDPAVSPDGELIAARVIGDDLPKPLRPGLYLFDARSGKTVRRLAGNAYDVDWSPDGKRLVYRTRIAGSETEDGTKGGNLFVVRRDGTGRRSLVHREGTGETHPTWSPDGKRIAWVSVRFGAGVETYRVRARMWSVPAKGGKPAPLAKLPSPMVEEGEVHLPELTWMALPG